MAATMTQLRDEHTDDNGNPSHRWAIIAENIIAELHVDPTTHEILWVWVSENHCGKGFAADLYRTATAEMEIFHAPEWHRTPEGNRWATTVGGPALDSCACCEHLFEFEEDDYTDTDTQDW